MQAYREAFKLESQKPGFPQFIKSYFNGLLNFRDIMRPCDNAYILDSFSFYFILDAMFLFDDSLSRLIDVKTIQVAMADTAAWNKKIKDVGYAVHSLIIALLLWCFLQVVFKTRHSQFPFRINCSFRSYPSNLSDFAVMIA